MHSLVWELKWGVIRPPPPRQWCSAETTVKRGFNHRPHLLFSPNENAPGGGEGEGATTASSRASVMELRDKDQRIAWDDPNIMVCELAYLCQPLTFQVSSKVMFPGASISSSFSSITSTLFETER